MEPVFYVVAILGCGDLGESCRTVRTAPGHHASAALCTAAMPAALQEGADVDAPMIQAECRRISTPIATLQRIASTEH